MAKSSSPSDLSIIQNPDAKRFEGRTGDLLAVVEYIEVGDRIIFSHTEVPKALEGKGVAGAMAHHALQYAKDKGLKVMPLCPYMAGYMRRHPEWKALLLPGYRVD